MSSFIHSYSFFFMIFSTAFLFSYITTLPIDDNPYKRFIDFLIKSNCTMPDEVELPFPRSSERSPFSYLSNPLKECQTLDALKENDEAKFLCREIFDVLENITCFEYNTPLPIIKKIPLSQNICNDLKSMQDVFPKGNNYLSVKLGDDILCKVLCAEEYEFLCKTLLWSHVVQAKINSALENTAKENEKGNMDKNAVSNIGAKSIKSNFVDDMPNSDKQEINNEMINKKISVDDTHTEDKKSLHDGLNNSESFNMSTSSVSGQTVSDKTTLTSNTKNGINMKTTNRPENPEMPTVLQNESEADNQKIVNNGLQSIEQNQNPQSKDINQDQNKINVESNPDDVKKVEKKIPLSPDTKVNNLIPKISSLKGKTNISSNNLQNEKHAANVSSDTNSEANVDSDNFVSKGTKMENELNNVDINGEEKEINIKQTNLKTDDEDKNIEKPKLTDFETPLDSPDTELKQLESTTLQILPDKDDDDVEHQEDKDQEQYNDTENEGDYPKSEYDNSFNPPLKNKESSVKSPVIEGSNQISNNYDTLINTRNNIGRVPDDIQMIPSFPVQEDSHFFFYFLSIVLILMAGYLIFHNKQKIIALIVEGRHERRRRSHGAGYKKLEAK